MLKIGHRGAPYVAPENTITAFHAAIAQGANGIELDVHRCKSGELVVIHDDTVDRTTDGKGAVADMDWSELTGLRIHGAERIALLDEVLSAISGSHCLVEVKHADAAHAVAALIERHVQSDATAVGRLWLISFQHEALAGVIADYPWLNVGASFESLEPASILAARGLGAKAIIPHHQPLSEKQVKEAQGLGLNVFCWTVNEPSDISRMKAMGVDGIISDYPERL